MAVIVTRITNPTGGTAKGSPLTSVEIDANFNNINDAKAEYPTQTGENGKYLQTNGSTASWSTLTNAATVTTNANLTGMVTSVGNATSLGSFTSAQLSGALTDETGTGANVFATSPTLTTPVINGFTGNTSVINIGSGQVYKDASGNVGIGTSSPAQILEVKELDHTGFTGIRANNPNGNVGSAGIEFQVDAVYSKAAIYQTRKNPNGVGDLIFVVDSASDAANWAASDEKMRIDSSGKVIISSLTASLPVFTDASNGLVSNAMTGTGNVVMSASPTITSPVISTVLNGAATLTLPTTTGTLSTVGKASALSILFGY